ncbi:hypothetical protein [Ectobacillus ponti]|uniref:Uncharacterized protein n=1 Tax=Ectobacillus ponti TaxID=2961894 RepID=A0AA41X289_9BACI|nr:hypothetical protein [Ectobacillus ponti]MCP8967596.1 hypothetical protein [Ectobacillus ponti]
MNLSMPIGTSLIAGILGAIALYFAFSRMPEQFYRETNESADATGFFIMAGWLFAGLHKLYRLLLPKHHSSALRLTMLIAGLAFLSMAVGVWFLPPSFS